MYYVYCLVFSLHIYNSEAPTLSGSDLSERTSRNTVELKSSGKLSGSTLQRVKNFFRNTLFRCLY